MHKQEKRRKYCSKPQRQQVYSLEPGIKGFLCSCNNREKDCVRESYNILNKYADQLYGTEKVDSERNTGDNVEDDLEKELDQLKSEARNVKVRRFQVVQSGAKNILFIKTTIDDPVALASTVVKDIQESKQLQSRFLIRLIPIQITCKAYVDDIKKTCVVLLDRYFKDAAKTFSIIYNHRNNSSLNKDVVIREVADLVLKTRNDHVVNLNNAEISIIVEVIKGIALLSVIPNYILYKKFNLHAFIDANKQENEDTEETKMPKEETNVHDSQ